MSMSLQVLYPADGDTRFDHAYYVATHMPLVDTHMGPFIATSVITRGKSSGPDRPADFHAIATFTFDTKEALDAALAAAGPVVGDIVNFYDGKPRMVFGEVIG